MPQRGKLVVLSFFLLAAVLAGGAIWYHFAKTRWAMTFWGNEAARLIVRAPEVEVWKLAPAAPPAETWVATSSGERTPGLVPAGLDVSGTPLQITGRRTLMAAPGLIHMRMALVEDANFDIQAVPPAKQNWDYAFRFFSPDQELIVVIDSGQGLVRAAGEAANPSQPIAAITPIAEGLQRFLAEQFKEPGDAKPAPAETKVPPAAESAPK